MAAGRPSAVFLLMVAESAGIPVPTELIMTFGGALAAGAVPGTSLNLAAVIIAGVAGNVVGSYTAWAAGRYGGQAATATAPQAPAGARTLTVPAAGSTGTAPGPS